VTIHDGSDFPPISIRNYSSAQIHFQQTGQDNFYVLLPMEQMDYALDAPSPYATQVLRWL